MPASMVEAREKMSVTVLAAWNDVTKEIYNTPSQLRWSSVPDTSDQSPESNVPWGRVTIQHTHGGQSQQSLNSPDNLIMWQRQGILTVQCFAPISLGNSYANAEKMACRIRDVLQRAQTCVWFRNCEAVEVGLDSGWFVFNAVASFTYSELK